jgi:hypothetical protein bacD2_18048
LPKQAVCKAISTLSDGLKGIFMKQAFIYTDDKSQKFWIIDAAGNDIMVNFGKLGTNGRFQNYRITAMKQSVKKPLTSSSCERQKKVINLPRENKTEAYQTNKAIIATAFGSITISGSLLPELHRLSLLAI